MLFLHAISNEETGNEIHFCFPECRFFTGNVAYGLVCLKLIVMIYQTIDIKQKESTVDYKQTKTPTAQYIYMYFKVEN